MELSTKKISEKMPSPYSAGLLCRCPRCGKGKLFEGFLTLKSSCDVCGLDFSFADCRRSRSDNGGKIPTAVLGSCCAVDPVDPASHAMAVARPEKSFDRIAVSSQGIAGKTCSASRGMSRLGRSLDRRRSTSGHIVPDAKVKNAARTMTVFMIA